MDDIDWEQSPKSTFKTATGEVKSLLDYYKQVSLAIPMFVSLSQTFVLLFLEHVVIVQWQGKVFGMSFCCFLCCMLVPKSCFGLVHSIRRVCLI